MTVSLISLPLLAIFHVAVFFISISTSEYPHYMSGYLHTISCPSGAVNMTHQSFEFQISLFIDLKYQVLLTQIQILVGDSDFGNFQSYFPLKNGRLLLLLFGCFNKIQNLIFYRGKNFKRSCRMTHA